MGFLRTISFLLLLLRWCFAHYFFLLLQLRWCVVHHLFSTLTITLVYCALIVFYFHYYMSVLCTICFLPQLLRWCFTHYLFYTFTEMLVFCALFVFYFSITLVFCALFVFFKYYVGVLRTICFLL